MIRRIIRAVWRQAKVRFREKARALRGEKERRRKETPQPRYDNVFWEGTAELDKR